MHDIFFFGSPFLASKWLCMIIYVKHETLLDRYLNDGSCFSLFNKFLRKESDMLFLQQLYHMKHD